jgi:hypothetical protein
MYMPLLIVASSLPMTFHVQLFFNAGHFFSRIHFERCINYIEERARKPEPRVLLPTGDGSSPTKTQV